MAPQTPSTTIKDLVNRFGFHPADTAEKREAHAQIRSAFLKMALLVNATLPPGREKTICLAYLEEGCRAANAALALSHGDALVGELDDNTLGVLYQSLYGAKPAGKESRGQLLAAVKSALGIQ